MDFYRAIINRLMNRAEGMSMNRNYQKELDILLEKEEIRGKRLFLHSCCAPCSSYVLEYLRQFFRITVFYYNPNITQESEYRKRVEEQKRLIAEYNRKREEKVLETTGNLWYPIDYVDGDYDVKNFLDAVKGMEACPEGGERCFTCYKLRLRETAWRAREGGYDFFTTTLTISPMKNAAKLNEIGEKLAEECGVAWLPSDFKKKNGYKRSIELSAEYGLYRQDYCGCAFSKAERERQKQGGLNEKDFRINFGGNGTGV